MERMEIKFEYDFEAATKKYKSRELVENAMRNRLRASGCECTLVGNEYTCIKVGETDEIALAYMSIIGSLCYSLLTEGFIKSCFYYELDEETGEFITKDKLPHILSEQDRIRKKMLRRKYA